MTLVDQNNPGIKVEGNTISIDTSLNSGLESFKANPERRGGILSALAQSIASVTGRKAMPVKLVDGETDMKIAATDIQIGKAHIEKALTWEKEGVEKGTAAIFGDVARAIAKRAGTEAISDAVSAAYSQAEGIVGKSQLAQSMANSIGSYVSVAPGLNDLIKEFPGLSGAVMASYVMQADAMNPGPMFGSEKASEVWRAVWTTLMAETFAPESIELGAYPSDEVREAIQGAAELLQETYDPMGGKVDKEKVEELVLALAPLFSEVEDTSEDAPADSSLDSDGEAMAVPVEIKKSVGIGHDLGNNVDVKPRVKGEYVRESALTSSMREWLADVRLENMAGQQQGRLSSQLHRIVTDHRVFSKRARIMEAPDACVVVAVDFSGSMGGIEAGYSRLNQACKLHDALVYALAEMDIPVASCAYCGASQVSHIYPLNLAHDTPVRSAFGMERGTWLGGNGDVGAMLWSTKQIAESGAKMGSIVFLADGEVGYDTARTFRQRAAELETSVFHVDYINAASSPFGGQHIHAAGLSIEDIAQPLAQGLAKALGLE